MVWRQPARQPSSSNGKLQCFSSSERCGAHELHLAHGLLALHVDAARRDRRLRLDAEQVLLRRRAVRRGERGAAEPERAAERQDAKNAEQRKRRAVWARTLFVPRAVMQMSGSELERLSAIRNCRT